MPITAVARSCVFCGATGKLTNEHAWPRWLINELLKPGLRPMRRWGKADALTGPDTDSRDVTVKRACRSCNTGWMADLETLVMPILRPWIKGQAARLIYVQQQHVAAWAVKTAMMLQYTPIRQGGTIIPSAQYTELYARKISPPDRVEVFIGIEPSALRGALFGIRGLAVRLVDPSPLVPRHVSYLGYEVTMIVGQLELRLLGHVSGPTDFAISEGMDLPAFRQLTKIWRPEASGGVLLPPTYRPADAAESLAETQSPGSH
ncbi:MAG: hypothetical protein M3003_08160 [Candidatus Dormibacteraeota bacterium]|nr:hypothetical protein [Candidatus Dormibacteraeota bacterium]